MKKQRKIEKDNRGVAIYARKSRITNKGDSIGVQFKQCADYAKKELGLDEEYEFLQYEDKGLSGYFSDRPDFQRMLHDVQDGKIKAIVCYKLDRVGRKTADLIRLMDFLEMYHVNLLICSNGINTASGLYKIFIQIFAVIAEFERDTLTERIVDNMMELAKDGRWLGGNTPMGFTVRRVTTGSGKGKSAYSYLESLPEEKCMVQRLYEIFRTTRSIQSTAKQMNEEGFHTPSGATFNASTTRLVLRNPIYCTADKRSYDYFIDHDGNVFGDMIEFDGTHGLSAYNKTDQEKYEGSDSTFISPKYVQTIESKPVSEWIIAVGKHEGFIPSEQWIEVQELLEAIAEKYNRPHRKTNALLAGLAHCPHCGRRLSVISESDRWTNGKPRFKYVCPGYRKKECNFKAVDGVLLDEFVVQQLSELSDENSERFRSILEIKIEEVLEQSQTVQEHNLIKKKRDKLKADIAAQTRNLREADGSIIAKFIRTKTAGIDLSKAYDMDFLEQPLADDNYYFVLTNNNFMFGQDWMCFVTFAEPIKTVVDDPIPVTPVEADKELVAQIMEELQPYFENYYTDIADRRNHADNYLVKCQELLATLDRDIVASEASPLAIDGLNPDVVFDKTAPLETQHWLTGLHEHTLDGYGIPVGSAEGESALVLSAYVPQHKGEVDGGAEVPLLYFFTYSVDDIQSPEDYAFIHGQIITFEQLEQYKVYEDDQYVCYEVTDLFYTNLRQHVESIISQRSDIYFDEQVWERVENIYTYYKDRDVLASRFYYNVPVE